jgi:GNAT superfamily N-acetyltransferase
MRPEIKIRRAKPDNAEGILHAREAAIRAKAAATYKNDEIDGWVGEQPLTPDSIARMKGALGDAKAHTYVAEYRGRIIGFSTVISAENILLRAFVAPGDWRGIGSQLIERAENEARKYGVAYLDCEASVNAEGFYARHGYEVVERGLYRMQCGLEAPCVRMKKRLAG